MENMETLATFFGWMTIINFGLLLFSTIMLVTMKDFPSRLHGKLFKMEPEELKPIYFRFLANYKILIIVFNAVPYIALKIIA